MLFVGEGPGRSEDALGYPFKGPTGRFLRQTITSVNPGVRVGFTNLVACRPVNKVGGEDRPPAYEEVLACSGRLKELIEIVKPVVVVAVGRVPNQYMHMSGWRGVRERIMHPSAVIQRGGEDYEHYPDWKKDIGRILERVHSLCQTPPEGRGPRRFRPAR